jgi:hypothetical protein
MLHCKEKREANVTIPATIRKQRNVLILGRVGKHRVTSRGNIGKRNPINIL